jgi:isopentenyldiphosphate isomerase
MDPQTAGQLEVVDENGRTIGVDSRENVHRKGLRHREVHVWFVTPKGEILFQRRALDKDTYPGKLDATVGGHLEPGDSFEQAAVREVEEETGLKPPLDALHPILVHRGSTYDTTTGMTNNVIRKVFGYRFHGAVDALRVEDGKATGFVPVPYAELKGLRSDPRFIPSLLEGDYPDIYRRLSAIAHET